MRQPAAAKAATKPATSSARTQAARAKAPLSPVAVRKARKSTSPPAGPAAPAAPRPLRRVSIRHDDRRTAILRAAAQLFAQRGYEATSLDAIAQQLGMHKATLYHYVASKEAILYDCLVASFSDLDQAIARMHERSVPLPTRLRDFVRSLAHAQNSDFGRCLVLVGERPLGLPPGGEIKKFQRRLDTTVRDLLEEGMAAGTLRPCDPGLVCAMLFGALNWVPRWFRDGGRLSVDAVADAFVTMLMQGISKRR